MSELPRPSVTIHHEQQEEDLRTHQAAQPSELSPMAQAVRKAIREHSFTDEQGRLIKLRKPGIIDQMDLIEILDHRATNVVYFQIASAVTWVCEIDGEACYFPTSMVELKALYQLLGEEGVNEVFRKVLLLNGGQDPEKEKQAIKKSATATN